MKLEKGTGFFPAEGSHLGGLFIASVATGDGDVYAPPYWADYVPRTNGWVWGFARMMMVCVCVFEAMTNGHITQGTVLQWI